MDCPLKKTFFAREEDPEKNYGIKGNFIERWSIQQWLPDNDVMWTMIILQLYCTFMTKFDKKKFKKNYDKLTDEKRHYN